MAARRYEISVRVLRNISRVSHSNGDLFTCKDNMVFSHMKISCFCGKAHLVFHFCLYNKYMLFTGLGRSVLGETVPEVLSTASGGTQTEGTVSPNTDRPRPVITFLFFSYWDINVSGKVSFALQPMCVEVGRVRVDETRDRLQTKTKQYNMIFSSVIYIMALTAHFLD